METMHSNSNNKNNLKDKIITNKKKVCDRVAIVLDEDDIEEHFVKGGGKGGQKINKTSSKVHLVHLPTGIRVACQEFRELAANRKRARSIMKSKLDDLINGERSKNAMRIKKIQKKKLKNSRKYEPYKGGRETATSASTAASRPDASRPDAITATSASTAASRPDASTATSASTATTSRTDASAPSASDV